MIMPFHSNGNFISVFHASPTSSSSYLLFVFHSQGPQIKYRKSESEATYIWFRRRAIITIEWLLRDFIYNSFWNEKWFAHYINLDIFFSQLRLQSCPTQHISWCHELNWIITELLKPVCRPYLGHKKLRIIPNELCEMKVSVGSACRGSTSRWMKNPQSKPEPFYKYIKSLPKNMEHWKSGEIISTISCYRSLLHSGSRIK